MTGLGLKIAFALTLALLVNACSATCVGAVDRYLDSGESYSYLNLSGTYVLFSINNSYSMLFDCSGEARAVTDPGEISRALSEYAGWSGSLGQAKPDQAWLQRMNFLLDSFSGSRAKESVCRTYTGTDRVLCNSMASCFAACSTPLCDVKYESGCELRGNQVSGCDFIKGLLQFSQDVSYLDNSTSKLKNIVANSANGETGPLEDGLATVGGMHQATGRINGNPLMKTNKEGGYYFCPTVPYDEASLRTFRDSLSDLRNRYALLSSPGEVSKQVASETARRIALRNDMDVCAENSNYTEKAEGELLGAGGEVSNYSEVLGAFSKLSGEGAGVRLLCSRREFANASIEMDRFRGYETGMRGLVSNLSAQYSETNALYERVLSELSSPPKGVNVSGLQESMTLVGREIPLVRNSADLAVLQGVLLENEKKLGATSESGPSLLSQAIVPLAVAALIAIILFFVIRKTRRQGL